jgi:hypothetical protein
MKELLVLVHTVTPLLPVFDRLVVQKLPGVRVKHILDEPLLEAVRLRGGLAEDDAGRLKAHIDLAEAIGAKCVLVTCSTISPLVDSVLAGAQIPVFKIDEAMLDAAVRLGPRIGVLAKPVPGAKAPAARAGEGGGLHRRDQTHWFRALDALLASDGGPMTNMLSAAIAAVAAVRMRSCWRRPTCAGAGSAVRLRRTKPVLSAAPGAGTAADIFFRMKHLAIKSPLWGFQRASTCVERCVCGCHAG